MADESKSSKSPEARLQAEVDEHTEQGFMGVETDPTPNEEYSLEKDSWKVPEADPKAAKAVGSSRFAGSADGDA